MFSLMNLVADADGLDIIKGMGNSLKGTDLPPAFLKKYIWKGLPRKQGAKSLWHLALTQRRSES